MAVELKLNGYDHLLERVQELNASVDDAARDSLQNSADRVSKELEAGIAKHRDTGRTAKSLNKTPKVESNNGKFSVKVGFKLPQGLPARYINKGTPTNRKDPFVDRATNKSKLNKERHEFLKGWLNQ